MKIENLTDEEMIMGMLNLFSHGDDEDSLDDFVEFLNIVGRV